MPKLRYLCDTRARLRLKPRYPTEVRELFLACGVQYYRDFCTTERQALCPRHRLLRSLHAVEGIAGDASRLAVTEAEAVERVERG